MYIFLIGIQVAVILLTMIAQALLIYGDGSGEQKMMSLFLSGATIVNIGYLLEMTASTMETALAAVKVQYFGVTFIPVFFCWFVYNYCYEKMPRNVAGALLLIDLIMLAIVFTCDKHVFFHKDVRWITGQGSHPYLNITYGTGWTLFLIFSCLIPYLMSLFALAHAAVTRPQRMVGRKYMLFISIAVMPMLALSAYIFKWYLPHDFTPAVLGISLSLIVILVWCRRNYDFSRLAADMVLRNMDDGVVMLDDDRRIVNYNPAAAAIFTELSSQTLGDSIDNMEDFPDGMLEEKTRVNFVLNKRCYESRVRRIVADSGKIQGYVVIVQDVTETQDYIEEIQKVREDAERANLTKREFLANMSHEIRTPMNAVVGLSDMIMEESRGRRVYGYAREIKAASQNLLAIINDILDLSKVESGKMELKLEDYYIKGIVGEIVNMMKVAASQKSLEMKCEYDINIPCRYNGDDGRIKQILINLMNNAVKFTKKGFVKITVGGQPGEQDDMENLVFRIQDTGVGIKQENLEKIFEDFKQVDSGRNRGVEGTGLGLSITRHFVRLMKGSIDVESVYGEGSTFTVTIPQKIVDHRTLKEVPEVPGVESEQLDMFVVYNYKVLVVDDNLINRKVAAGFLKNYGFDIYEAASGSEAIEMVHKTKFNMIFMDHMMPEMDGVEATRIIREECGLNGQAPVIIALTANAMTGVRERFLNSGFQDFLAKPLDKKPLNELLSRWIPNAQKKMQNQAGDEEAESKPEIDFEDIHIEGIDIDEAQKHHTGDVDDYLELLNLYCIDGKRKFSFLDELVKSENYKDYGIEAHGLKSASANIGAMELSSQAKEHEDAATRGDIDFIKRHSPELLYCYGKQIDAIRQFLDRRHEVTESGDDVKDESLDRAALTKALRDALKKLEDFKSKECAKVIKDLRGYRWDSSEAEKLSEIQEQLSLYEDDNAEKLLREMIECLEKED